MGSAGILLDESVWCLYARIYGTGIQPIGRMECVKHTLLFFYSMSLEIQRCFCFFFNVYRVET